MCLMRQFRSPTGQFLPGEANLVLNGATSMPDEATSEHNEANYVRRGIARHLSCLVEHRSCLAELRSCLVRHKSCSKVASLALKFPRQAPKLPH